MAPADNPHTSGQWPQQPGRPAAPAGQTQGPGRAEQAGVSALARHADPSLAAQRSAGWAAPAAKDGQSKPGRGGIEWVRAADLLTAWAAGAGSRFGLRQESTIRRARAAVNPVSRRGTARRSASPAVKLPPVTAFGAQPPTRRNGGQAVAP